MACSVQDSLLQEARKSGVVEADPLDPAGRVTTAYLVLHYILGMGNLASLLPQ